MQICIERIGENSILMHFHAVVRDICSSGELESILITITNDFSMVWNYGKFPAKFLLEV